jgi:hypothetical protein
MICASLQPCRIATSKIILNVWQFTGKVGMMDWNDRSCWSTAWDSKFEGPACAQQCRKPFTTSVSSIDTAGLVTLSSSTSLCINFHALSAPSDECCLDQCSITSTVSFKVLDVRFPGDVSSILAVRFLHVWFGSSRSEVWYVAAVGMDDWWRSTFWSFSTRCLCCPLSARHWQNRLDVLTANEFIMGASRITCSMSVEVMRPTLRLARRNAVANHIASFTVP